MTPLERAVLDAMVKHNRPIASDDPPYPASLMPIVRAVIAAVRGHDSGDALPGPSSTGGVDLTDQEASDFLEAIA